MFADDQFFNKFNEQYKQIVNKWCIKWVLIIKWMKSWNAFWLFWHLQILQKSCIYLAFVEWIWTSGACCGDKQRKKQRKEKNESVFLLNLTCNCTFFPPPAFRYCCDYSLRHVKCSCCNWLYLRCAIRLQLYKFSKMYANALNEMLYQFNSFNSQCSML